MNAMKVRLQIYNTMHHHSLQVHEQFDHYTPSSYGISMFKIVKNLRWVAVKKKLQKRSEVRFNSLFVTLLSPCS